MNCVAVHAWVGALPSAAAANTWGSEVVLALDPLRVPQAARASDPQVLAAALSGKGGRGGFGLGRCARLGAQWLPQPVFAVHPLLTPGI